MNILVVEDSDKLRRSLRIGLTNEGYSVDETANGSDALAMLKTGDYNIVILDLMLPSISGLDILKQIRHWKKSCKVMILSAKNQVQDKVKGLQCGADDYLTKPFAFDELQARLTALNRRGELLCYKDKISLPPFMLDINNKNFFIKEHPIALTPTEYKIIECLFINKNKMMSVARMSEYIVGQYDAMSKNAIEAHLSSIRRKIKPFKQPLPITNKRGFGYIAGNL